MNRIAAFSAFALSLAFLPQAAHAQSGCTAYAAQSAKINPTLDNAVALIGDGKVQEGIQLLPQLEALLAEVPAKMPAPEKCGADVHVFDDHQFAGFEALISGGKTVSGYPANANFVFKESPFANLAYITGWLTYENGDFTKALGIYNKGLAIAPGNHELVNEVLATQLQLNDPAAVVSVAQGFLDTDTDADATLRSNVTLAKSIGLAMQNDFDAADAAVDEALALWPENENAAAFKKQLAGEPEA